MVVPCARRVDAIMEKIDQSCGVFQPCYNIIIAHNNIVGVTAMQTAPMAPLQCTLPAPPPYMLSSEGGNVYIGWAAPYDGLDDGAKPPLYDEIGNEKNSKN